MAHRGEKGALSPGGGQCLIAGFCQLLVMGIHLDCVLEQAKFCLLPFGDVVDGAGKDSPHAELDFTDAQLE